MTHFVVKKEYYYLNEYSHIVIYIPYNSNHRQNTNMQ
jgi:hypothetical protein